MDKEGAWGADGPGGPVETVGTVARDVHMFVHNRWTTRRGRGVLQHGTTAPPLCTHLWIELWMRVDRGSARRVWFIHDVTADRG